jgi:CheY-like chemotaxis protein
MNQIFVLLADDDEEDRLFLRETMEEHLGQAIIIHEAENGKQALERLNQPDKKFSLILLDINMPLVNGIEVLEQIRSRGKNQCTPTVIISTSNSERYIAKAYQKGANSYITKPNSYLGYKEVVEALTTCFLDTVRDAWQR